MDAYLKLAEDFIEDFYTGECDWSKVPSHLLLVRSVVDSALYNMEQLDKLTDSMNKASNRKILLKDTEDYEHFHLLLVNDIFYIAMHWYINDDVNWN